MIEFILMAVGLLLVVYIISWFINRNKYLSKFATADTIQTILASSLPASSGYNYTYSIWIYINDWSYKYGTEKIIFVHGENGKHMPSVSLDPIENNIKVSVDMQNNEVFECTVQDIPLQKWTNVLVTMNTKSLDNYINGKLVKTCVLPSPPSIDYNAPIYITPLQGFSGYTSRFNYWSETINPQQAWNIYKQGPGTTSATNFFNDYSIQLNFLKGTDVKASVSI